MTPALLLAAGLWLGSASDTVEARLRGDSLEVANRHATRVYYAVFSGVAPPEGWAPCDAPELCRRQGVASIPPGALRLAPVPEAARGRPAELVVVWWWLVRAPATRYHRIADRGEVRVVVPPASEERS